MILLDCYPTFYDYFATHFKIHIEIFKLFHSFGFFVAIAFMTGIFLLRHELRRREKLGLLPSKKVKVMYGTHFKISDLLFPAIAGFVIGWKSIGILTNNPMVGDDPGAYFMSFQEGSIICGFIGAIIFCALEYRNIKKNELPEPEERIEERYPSDETGAILLIAAIAGVFGSNLFNTLEHPETFSELFTNPSSLLSGLNIFGGLICAGISLAVYAFVKKIKQGHFFDSLGSLYLIAYAIGRLGCQTAGDGCWGVPNPHEKPSFVPQILWSSTYKDNIIHECDPYQGQYFEHIDTTNGNSFKNCNFEQSHQLMVPVYPTPLYEFLFAGVLGITLWGLRKKLTSMPGVLISLMFVMNGMERYLIEQIRVNEKLRYLGLYLTQGEFIAILMLIFGSLSCLLLYLYYNHKSRHTQPSNESTEQTK